MHNIEATSPSPPPQEETVIQIPLSELHPFPNHPFKLRDDDGMREMVESVREYGVLTPAIVRPCEDGGYEIIAGHRRKYASGAVGLNTIPAIIRDMNDDAATILMVDSNIQREDVLPSEKAQAYRMKLDAIKRQGAHRDRTCDQPGHKLKGKKSVEMIAEESGDSKTQIQRYIRLTKLSPQLQQMVDDGEIAITPAVELSHLKPEEQELVAEFITQNQRVPTLSQAQQMKRASQESSLDSAAIVSIMSPTPSSVEKEQPEPTLQKPAAAVVQEKERPASEPDAPLKRERTPLIADDILRLKDTTKECRCTPEIFLSTFAEYVGRSQREMEVFMIPFYEEVFPTLLPEHMGDLRRQIEMIHAAADKFYDEVKGRNERE